MNVLVPKWRASLSRACSAMASKEVLKRFISLLLFIPLGSTLQGMDESKNYDMAPNGILLRVLQSAQFWELQNIRSMCQASSCHHFGNLCHLTGVLLSSMLEITAPLSRCAFPSQQVIPDDLDLFCVGEIYPLLVHVPSEYFTRYSRTELMKRALGGDVGICIVLQHGEKATKGPENQHTIWDKPVEDWLRLLIAIRTFLLHAGQSASALDHDVSWQPCCYIMVLIHMMRHPERSSSICSIENWAASSGRIRSSIPRLTLYHRISCTYSVLFHLFS